MTRKKKIKTLLYSFIITVVLFIIGLATIILYPQPLFANKVEYKQFKVYSNEKISDEIKPVLDTALSFVKKSELYDSTYKVDLFLGFNTFFNSLDDKVFGRGPTAKALDNNLIFKVKVDVNSNACYTTFPKPCIQKFTYLIAHEMTHCLQAHKYGTLKFSPFKHPEMWKLEGYPEYIARQKFLESSDNLKKDINNFIKLKHKQTGFWISEEEGGCETPEFYYKGRLMTEYLINIKGFTYDRILKEERSEEKIFAEMTEWANR